MRKGDLKRAQILDAAEKLFFERGYDRTSIQDILDALGMSKGGFYHYFDAKDDVLREISARRAMVRFERLNGELYSTRRSPIERLNLLLSLPNLFLTEDVHFAALMLKLCYQQSDASILAHRRRILVDQLTPLVNDVIGDGIAEGVLHTRYPMEVGRLLLLLACDVDDEACALLAAEPDNPDAKLHLLELLNAWRESVETLAGAPFGSIQLFDPGQLIGAWQAATAELSRLEDQDL